MLNHQPTTTCLGEWVTAGVEVDKYVDDNLQEEKVNFENALVDHITDKPTKNKHIILTQNVFRHIVRRVCAKGMKVNSKKTNLLCISDAQNFVTQAFFVDNEGNTIESSNTMKVLGFHFSERPNMDTHVAVMKRRFRERYWILVHLQNNGFKEEELLEVYKMNIRPVADYLAEVYHSSLSDRQDEEVERLQSHALRCIYGPRLSARKLKERAGVTSLRDRRIDICDKFADKCIRNERFSHWFPRNEGGRKTRSKDIYKEEFARCHRLYNSTLFYLRRRKNGKEGKRYRVRNRIYRE